MILAKQKDYTLKLLSETHNYLIRIGIIERFCYKIYHRKKGIKII